MALGFSVNVFNEQGSLTDVGVFVLMGSYSGRPPPGTGLVLDSDPVLCHRVVQAGQWGRRATEVSRKGGPAGRRQGACQAGGGISARLQRTRRTFTQ